MSLLIGVLLGFYLRGLFNNIKKEYGEKKAKELIVDSIKPW